MNRDTCPHEHTAFSAMSGKWCTDCGAFLNQAGQTWTMERDFCREECRGRCVGECQWPQKKMTLEEFLKT